MNQKKEEDVDAHDRPDNKIEYGKGKKKKKMKSKTTQE